MIHQCQGHPIGDLSPRGQNSVIMMITMKKSHRKIIVMIIIPVLYRRSMGVTITIFNLQITKRGEHKEANHIVPQGLQKETNLEILNDKSTENQKRCTEVDPVTAQGLQIGNVQGLQWPCSNDRNPALSSKPKGNKYIERSSQSRDSTRSPEQQCSRTPGHQQSNDRNPASSSKHKSRPVDRRSHSHDSRRSPECQHSRTPGW